MCSHRQISAFHAFLCVTNFLTMLDGVAASRSNLRATPPVSMETLSRDLIATSNMKELWAKLVKADYGTNVVQVSYKNLIGWDIGTDMFKVNYDDSDGVCYIFAQESTSLGNVGLSDYSDWVNNFKSFSAEIKDSGYTVDEQYEECQLAWAWGWVPYRHCTKKTRKKTILDKGVAGFVDGFNVAAPMLQYLMENVCLSRGAEKFQYAGYSRGGGLVQIAALQHFRKGIFTATDDVSLILFNSPNALEGWSANALAENLDEATDYIRYSGSLTDPGSVLMDPVSVLPPGYKKPTTGLLVECPGATDLAAVHICGGK